MGFDHILPLSQVLLDPLPVKARALLIVPQWSMEQASCFYTLLKTAIRANIRLRTERCITPLTVMLSVLSCNDRNF